MQALLKSYRETLYQLRRVKIDADQTRDEIKNKAETDPSEENQRALERAQDFCDTVNAFVSNVLYVVTWLTKGYAPNPRRAIHRRSREQREVLMDPLKMQSYANPGACGSPTTITDSERFMLDEAMYKLTDNERDCYKMKYGQCFTEYEIAEILGISRTTVQKYVERAETKINDTLRNNIFLS